MSGIYIGAQHFGSVRPPGLRVYLWRGYVRVPQNPLYLSRRRLNVRDALEVAQFGSGMIEGVLQIQGIPSSGRVFAIDRRDMRVKGAAVADKVTGKWRVYSLVAQRGYLVVSADPKTRFNAVVADGVQPVEWEDEA